MKMQNAKAKLSLLAGLAVAILIGWQLGRLAGGKGRLAETSQSSERPTITPANASLSGNSESRKPAFQADEEALDAGALPGQRTLRFATAADLEAFLARAGDRVRVMDRIHGLNILRVGFLNPTDLHDFLDGSEEMGFIYPAYTPRPSGGMVQADAVPLGNQLLKWLGLDSADLTLGQGVKIAILDTGVVPHPAFGEVKNVFLVPGVENYADWNGHGTAAASLILGNTATVPGAAPGAELTSWRVADDAGVSDSWKIAQAIIQAADAGNQIISLSMGSYGDSAVLRDAVIYAQSKNVVIIASSGNDGYTQAAYPASYPDVIAAVGVDARNEHLLFSNQASNSSLAAPGWGVAAAYPGDSVIGFSGTSASAPIIAGTVAAVMSSKGYSTTQAVSTLYQYTNEAGPAGFDSYTGAGAVNLGRILQSENSNIMDAAVASHFISPPVTGKSAQVQVNIQNQGTTTLSNVPVSVTTSSGVTQLTVPSLAPGAVKSFTIGLPNSAFSDGKSVTVKSQISTNDSVISNNYRSTTYTPPVQP
jgi:hypothetical protein